MGKSLQPQNAVAVRQPATTPPSSAGPAAVPTPAANEPVTAESLGWQLRAALPPLRLHSVSLYDEQANILWLSEGALGPDEHNVVLEAIDALGGDTSLSCHESGLEDGRVAISLPVRAPHGGLVGVGMILADIKSVSDGVLERMTTPQIRTILQRVAVLLRPAPARSAATESPLEVLELEAAVPAAAAPPPPARAAAPVLSPQAIDDILEFELTPDVAKPVTVPKAVAPTASTPGPSASPSKPATSSKAAVTPKPAASSKPATPALSAVPTAPAPVAGVASPASIPMLDMDGDLRLPSLDDPAAAPASFNKVAALPLPGSKVNGSSGWNGAPAVNGAPVPVLSRGIEPGAIPTLGGAPTLNAAATPMLTAVPVLGAAASGSAPAVSTVSSSAAADAVAHVAAEPVPQASAAPAPAAAPVNSGATSVNKAFNASLTGTSRALGSAAADPSKGPGATSTSRVLVMPEGMHLILEVQPFTKLRTGGRTRRYEVLVRSSHPNRVPPGIDKIALQQLLTWMSANRAAWNLEPTSFTLNLSIATLEDERFPQFVASNLKTHGIAADNIGFEIAEALCLQRRAQVERFITLCDKLGCFVVIDDFSLDSAIVSLLRSKALRLVKIDPKLTSVAMKDKLAQAMVVAIAQAVKVLGIHCAAKRVESQAALQWLTAIGCDFAQGLAVAQVQPLETLGLPPTNATPGPATV